MNTVFRAGGMPTREDVENESALWFDSLSSHWLEGEGTVHVPRAASVFSAMRLEDALWWAEFRTEVGEETTVWAVTVPDEVELQAYEFRLYDEAVWGNRRGDDEDDVVRTADAYWLSGMTVDRFLTMWSRCMEGYDYPEKWEVKIPFEVAAAADWERVCTGVKDDFYRMQYTWHSDKQWW